MLVVGWGRITNNKEENRENLLRHKVSTRTLRKLLVPIVGTDCSTQEIVKKIFDFTKQVCAGGEARKFPYSFTNYVDMRKWIGSPKKSTFGQLMINPLDLL